MRATRPVAMTCAVGLIGLGSLVVPRPASAYQVPAAPFTEATTVMPGSGLRQTITATGRTEVTDPTTAGFRGSGPATYRPTIGKGTPAQDVVVNTGDCASTGGCGDRGTVTLAFSQPVRNPVLHLGGLGGSVTRTVSGRTTAQSELHAVLKLATAGLSLTKLGQGNNLAVTGDTITAADHDTGPNCVNTKSPSGLDTRATAACGSVRVNGVVTKVSFDVSAVFTQHPKLPALNNATSGDAFSIVASTPEDFGDAPASYGAARSVLSDVQLGTSVTEDNADVANGTTGPGVPDAGDDGVTFPPLRITQTSYAADVQLAGASKPGRACAWIDADVSGTFEPAERACAAFAVGQTKVTLRWAELAPKVGASWVRVRVGYTDAQVEKPTGAADSGEVEDHPLAITPPPPPVLTDDTATTAFNTATVVKVLANDKPGDPAAPLAPATLCLVDGAHCAQLMNVVGQAKYVAKPDGTVRVEPVPGFVGTAKPVSYRVADTAGTAATAKVTVTVALPDRPVATPDTATTPQNTSVSVKPLANDRVAAGVQLVPGSVVLRDPADATFKKKVVIAGEGEYVVKPDGGVDFVPKPQFTGPGTTIGYRVSDTTRQTAESTLTVTVTAVTPTANGDSVSTAFDTAVVVPVLDNDLPGSPDAPLVPASLRLVDPVSKKLVTQLTLAGQGTYLVANGAVTFRPVHGFAGVGTAVTYQVLDKNGTAATAMLTVTVAKPPVPTATPDAATGKQNLPLKVIPLANDQAGAGTVLVPGSVMLIDPADGMPKKSVKIAGQADYRVDPDGTVAVDPLPSFTGTATKVTYQVADEFAQLVRSTIAVTITPITPVAADDAARTPYEKTVTVPVLANDKAGDPSAPLVSASLLLADPSDGSWKPSVRIPNEGVYAAAGGAVRFDPSALFRGPGTPITYQVADSNGTTTTARLTVTVGRPPMAVADTASTLQNVSVSVNVLSNDRPGTDATLVRSSVGLDGSAKKLTIEGQGTYVVQPDGAVAFDPLPAFRGKATPIRYRVIDSDGNVATSTLTVTVTPINPVAVNDSAITSYGTPVTVPVAANDTAGDASAPLKPSSVALKDAAGHYGKTMTRAGEGTYAVDAAGAVTFTPAKGFHGVTTPTTYRIADANGTPAEGLLLITVGEGPQAAADRVTTKQNVTVVADVLANDKPGTGAQLDPKSLQVFGPGAVAAWASRVTIPGQGVFAVKSGKVEFDPEPAYRGVASVAYRVRDTTGNLASSTMTVTVTPVVPAIADDVATTPYGIPVTVGVLANDKPGDASAPLVAGGVRLIDPATGDPRSALVVAGEGTFTVQPTGAIQFAPGDGFVGATVPVGYQVADRNGTIGFGTLTVTVQARPVAVPDEARTKQHVAVTIDPLANDIPGPGATLDPESLLLVGADGVLGGQVTSPGQGVYVVADGKVTFTPEAAFTGTAKPVTYEVKDRNRNAARATISVTVVPVRPVVTDDDAETAYGTAVRVPVLANDKPGDSSAPLRPDSVVLRDPADGQEKKSVTVPEEGTFAVAAGVIEYTPAKGFAGTTRPLAYRVSDSNGTSDTAFVVVTVAGPLLAKPRPGTSATDAPAGPATPSGPTGAAPSLKPVAAFTETAAVTSGPPPIVLTLGALLAALGTTLFLIARTRK